MLSSKVFFEELVLRELSASPFSNKSFFHVWSVTGREIRVLECLCRFDFGKIGDAQGETAITPRER